MFLEQYSCQTVFHTHNMYLYFYLYFAFSLTLAYSLFLSGSHNGQCGNQSTWEHANSTQEGLLVPQPRLEPATFLL